MPAYKAHAKHKKKSVHKKKKHKKKAKKPRKRKKKDTDEETEIEAAEDASETALVTGSAVISAAAGVASETAAEEVSEADSADKGAAEVGTEAAADGAADAASVGQADGLDEEKFAAEKHKKPKKKKKPKKPKKPKIEPTGPDFKLQGHKYADPFVDAYAAKGFVWNAGVPQVLSAPPERFWMREKQGVPPDVAAGLRAPAYGAEMARLVAVALVTGQQNLVPQPLQQAYRASGLAHILSVSGLHMALVGGGVFFVLRALLALIPAFALRFDTKRWAAVAGVAAVSAYMGLIVFSVPAVRSFIMLLFLFGAILMERAHLAARALWVAALFVLFLYPDSVLSPSFYLSFAATYALAVWAVSSGFAKDEDLEGGALGWRKRGLLGGGLSYVKGVWMTGLVAGFATLPIAAGFFGTVSLGGFVANMAGVPLTGFWIMPVAVLASLAILCGAGASVVQPLLDGLFWGTAKLNNLAVWTAQQPWSFWALGRVEALWLTSGVSLLGLLWVYRALWVPVVRAWMRRRQSDFSEVEGGVLYQPAVGRRRFLLWVFAGVVLAVGALAGGVWGWQRYQASVQGASPALYWLNHGKTVLMRLPSTGQAVLLAGAGDKAEGRLLRQFSEAFGVGVETPSERVAGMRCDDERCVLTAGGVRVLVLPRGAGALGEEEAELVDVVVRPETGVCAGGAADAGLRAAVRSVCLRGVDGRQAVYGVYGGVPKTVPLGVLRDRSPESARTVLRGEQALLDVYHPRMMRLWHSSVNLPKREASFLKAVDGAGQEE